MQVSRRAITLLELLLAIALLLALTAIALPAVFTSFHERAFRASTETVRNQLLLARAHAQATGKPVEVLYHGESPRVTGRYFQAALDDAALRDDDRNKTLSITESWADRALTDGVRLADRPEDGDRPAGVADATGTLRLAVYMPDGSALIQRPVWVRDERGRIARISLNPWTGLPSIERDAAGAEPAEPESPEAAEQDPAFDDGPEPEADAEPDPDPPLDDEDDPKQEEDDEEVPA